MAIEHRRPWCRAFAWTNAFTAGDVVVGAVAVVLCIYFWVTPGIFQGKASGDGFFGFMYLPGVLLHHTLDVGVPAPEWAAILGHTTTGVVANRCPIGPAIVWAPTYLVGLGLQKLGLAAQHQPGAFGRREFDFFMAALGSLILVLLAHARLFVFLRRRTGVGAARAGVVVAALASPLTWYTVVQPTYQHACSYALVVFFIERWDAWRGQMTLPRWAALGALGGGAALMRPQEVLFLFVPAADVLFGALTALRAGRARDARVWLGGGLVCAAAALLVESPQLLVFRHYYGSVRPVQDPAYFLLSSPAVIEALFSMRAGIFPWVPSAYLAVAGFALARGRARIGVTLVVVGLLEFWLNSSVWDFHGCFSFGPRRYCDLVPLLALGGALLYERARVGWPRRLVIAGVVLVCAHNLLLTEGMRTRKLKSSGAQATRASAWNTALHGPRFVGALLDAVGYPFVQPAGWIFALVYHVPPATFEDITGDYLSERDWHIHSMHYNDNIIFAEEQSFVVSGVRVRGGRAFADGAPLRALVPMMVSEPVRLRIKAKGLGLQPPTVRWNGQLRPVLPAGSDEVVVNIDADIVHHRARANELVIEGLAAEQPLDRVAVELSERWWEQPTRSRAPSAH